MNVIKLEHHLRVLEEKHDILDKEIHEEYKHHVDDAELKKKKIKKLEIKQEIELIKQKIAS